MIQSLLYHLPGRQDAEPGVRGHITRDLQVKPRSLNFILMETGSCGSKGKSFSRAEGMEACWDRRHYFLDAKPPVILLAPYVLAERETKGPQETEIEAGRTEKGGS